MPKVLILVEGQTEETFIKRTLGPHLSKLGVFMVPTILVTKRLNTEPNLKGGILSYARVKKDILRLLEDTSATLVTTMFDYYGLPDSFPGRSNVQGISSAERVRHVENAIAADIAAPRFLAYCSLHEFEALLFASPANIAEAFEAPHLGVKLYAVRSGFLSPEDINDNPSTSPSARLRAIYPQYGKVFHGTSIASSIGLETMRAECSHFNEWLTRLEMLSDTTNNPDRP